MLALQRVEKFQPVPAFQYGLERITVFLCHARSCQKQQVQGKTEGSKFFPH